MTEGLFSEKLIEHFLLSASAILVGAGLAWPASKWLSEVLDRRMPVGPGSRIWNILFSWRAIVVTLIVFPILAVRSNILLGYRIPFYVLAGLSLSVASFVMGVTLLTQARDSETHTKPTSAARFASLRTLATLMVALAIPGYKGFAGASVLILIALDLPELGTVAAGIVVVAVVALIFDLLFGYVHYRIADRAASAPLN